MNRKTIAAISLSNRDFDSFAARMDEAVRWIDLAARQGADLVVLPETLNLYKGDGIDNPNAMTFAEAALDDWQTETAPLIDAAKRCNTTLTIPVVERCDGALSNCFHLIGPDGDEIGCYRKARPAPPELEEGVIPGGAPEPIEWEGLKIGGAICFDTNFAEVFDHQAQRGADLFVIPSLWPGGDALNHVAREYCTPIAIAYPAWSRIIDVDGREVAEGGYRNETLRFGFGAPIVMAEINFDKAVFGGDDIQRCAVKMQHTYGDKIRVRFNQNNCRWFVESVADDLTIDDVKREFNLLDIIEERAAYRRELAKTSDF